MSNFAIYLENNFICIRVDSKIAKHNILTYNPYTNYTDTEYIHFELLYDYMKKCTEKYGREYTFVIVDREQYVLNISYQYKDGKRELSIVSFDENGSIDCEVSNYIVTDEDLEKMKTFMDDLKAYMRVMMYISFLRTQ